MKTAKKMVQAALDLLNPSNIKYKLRRVYRWAVKTVQYSIFLWDDYDWDYGYIFKLLKYKLQRTRQQITKNNFISKSSIVQINREIKYAEKLIDRIMADDYSFRDPEYKRLVKKWGKADFFEDDIPGVGQYRRSKVKNKKDNEKCLKEFIKVYRRGDAAKEADMDELFNHLRKNIEGWWD